MKSTQDKRVYVGHYFEAEVDSKEFLKNLRFYYGKNVSIDFESSYVCGPIDVNEKAVHAIYSMTQTYNSKLKHEISSFECTVNCVCVNFDNKTEILLPTGCTINGEVRDENIVNLSKLFKLLAKTYFDSSHVTVPNIIGMDVLTRTGYFEKFPNQAIIVSVMRLEPELALNFSSGQFDSFDHRAFALNPVTCYHIYSNFSSLYERYKNNAYTLTGKAHRFEGLNSEKGRKSEFDIVEIVFFESTVSISIDKIIEFYNELFNMLGLSVRYVTSSDSFFSKDADLSAKLQLRTSSKIEIEVVGSQLTNNVIASINSHADYFVERFSLDKVGIKTTKCTGFGVERLLDHLEEIYSDNANERISDAVSMCS